jgi:cellulose biosynthesis protein BcsQ
MTTTIAIYSNKGGVGKTATAVNLAYLAAQSGRSTLVCDLDPQSSATFYFRVKPKLKKEARGFSSPNKAITTSIKGTDYANLDLLPADFTHRNLDILFHEKKHPTERLRRTLAPLQAEYDLIFLDCLPTINIIAENIFQASDRLLIPIIPTTLAVRAFEQMLVFLEKEKYDLDHVYTFFSMVDARKKLHREVMTAVQQTHPHVLQTPIPALSLVEQMGIHRQPLPAFAPNAKATTAYRQLWDEFQQKALA